MKRYSDIRFSLTPSEDDLVTSQMAHRGFATKAALARFALMAYLNRYPVTKPRSGQPSAFGGTKEPVE